LQSAKDIVTELAEVGSGPEDAFNRIKKGRSEQIAKVLSK
jgi:hypothetical protein